MSEKERDTLVVLERVKRRELTMAGATRLLRISYRQCRRRMRRYEEEGAQGLTHRLRGGGGNRSMAAEVKERIVELYRGRYEGFGPVLKACEAGGGLRDQGGSRDGAAFADKRRAVETDEKAEKAAQGMAAEAAAFWRDGADGWIASPLV